MTAPAKPAIATYRLRARDGSETRIDGKLLGSGTSDDGYKPRWTEVDLYRAQTGEFYVHVRGCSVQEGEQTRYRLQITRSAYEVVELLTVAHNGKTYIPRQSARCLAQAAQWDEDIKDAYINRAVT
jgi:hypothetical protein